MQLILLHQLFLTPENPDSQQDIPKEEGMGVRIFLTSSKKKD